MKADKGTTFMNWISTEKLLDLYKVEKHPKAKIRLQCAILRKKGKNLMEICEATNLPVQTISGTLIRFEERGVVGKDAIKQTGQPPKLSAKQKKQLVRVIQEPPTEQGLPFAVWTSKLIQYIIKKKFDVTYVLRQIYNLMNDFGFSIQKPRPEHLKANKELQLEFKKNCDDELRNLIKQDMRSSFWTKQSSH